MVELMIVVAIVAALAAVAIVAYTRYMKSGRLVSANAFLVNIQGQQSVYFRQNGYYCNASNGTNFEPALTAGEPKSKPWTPSAGKWSIPP